MPDATFTQLDWGALCLETPKAQDDVVTFAGADDLVAGTILARDSVSKKLRIFVKGGSTNENGIPKVILLHPLSAAGAGDKSCRVAKAGRFNKRFCVIDADGTAANIDAVVEDQLRDYGIFLDTLTQLSAPDNT